MGEHVNTWPTVAQAAEATGYTPSALRQRVKRGRLRAVTGADGLLHLDPKSLRLLPPPGEKTQGHPWPTLPAIGAEG